MQGVTFCNDLNQAVFVTYVVFVYLCIFVVRSSVVSNPGAPALLSSSHNMQGVTTLHARRNNMQGVTFCKFLFEKSADFEVQFLALQEEIDGIFLSYIVVHGIPWVCEALAKSRHEFSQKSQSCKKLRLACSLFDMQGVTDCITMFASIFICRQFFFFMGLQLQELFQITISYALHVK